MKKQYVLTVFVNGDVRLDMLTQDQILAKCKVQDKNVRRWGIIPQKRAFFAKNPAISGIWFRERHGVNGLYWNANRAYQLSDSDLSRLFGY